MVPSGRTSNFISCAGKFEKFVSHNFWPEPSVFWSERFLSNRKPPSGVTFIASGKFRNAKENSEILLPTESSRTPQSPGCSVVLLPPRPEALVPARTMVPLCSTSHSVMYSQLVPPKDLSHKRFPLLSSLTTQKSAPPKFSLPLLPLAPESDCAPIRKP